ncbi:MAG: helix-turn-helix transcriptional regulator [Anaerolineae bacterium]|jgi:DNA-binding PadR family transcriptional regulator|nr:helix-turn-helix transcriptional regulator [Anaerolineae bacterium]
MERELLLLGLLRREDMHGYQLHEFIERNMTSCTDLKKPTAYHLLEKMTERGWLQPSPAQAGNRPARRVYRITPAGEAAFQALLRENVATHYPAYFTGNIGLAYLDALPAPEALARLRERHTSLAAELARLTAVPPHAGSLQWLIDHQRHHLRAELDWLETLIQHLTAVE